MQLALRPYASAGVAIVGAGLIAVTPVTPVAAPLPDMHTLSGVALTAGGSLLADSLNPYIEQYNQAVGNLSTLMNNYYLAPGVDFQQYGVVFSNYLNTIFNDPASIPTATAAIQDAFKAAWSSNTLINADASTITTAQEFTLGPGTGGILGLIPGFLPSTIDPAMVNTVLHFLSSPASGAIMGAIGPGLAPWVALGNSISDGDSFSQIMANMSGAFFNGATLNLDSLLPLINSAGVLPAPIEIHHMALELGGLFSTGTVSHDPWQITDSAGTVLQSVPVPGGSILGSLDLNLIGVPVLGTLNLEGHGVGPLASWLSTSELTGVLLGSQWGDVGTCEGKGCTAPITPPFPPGSGWQIPTIPTIDDGTAGSSAATLTDDGLWGQLTQAFTDWQWNDVL